jgi:hypothetical protein
MKFRGKFRLNMAFVQLLACSTAGAEVMACRLVGSISNNLPLVGPTSSSSFHDFHSEVMHCLVRGVKSLINIEALFYLIKNFNFELIRLNRFVS